MFSNKRILFICTPFHEYPIRIKEAMESFHGKVDLYFIEQKSILSTIFLNINRNIYNKFRNYQQNKILNYTKNIKYDFVFIQYPFFLTHDFFETLKFHQPTAKFVNYNWDSIEARDFRPYMKYFDKVFSFDSQDCINNQDINYLPLFFSNDFKVKRKKIKYDLIFIGGIGDSEKRLEFVNAIEKICTSNGFRFYKHLYCSVNFFTKSLIKGKIYWGVRFKKLSLANIAYLYSESKCVVDYQNPKQHGLTMRTFEVLGSGCKLITTNVNILSEPFMNIENICIVDKYTPEIMTEFILREVPSLCSFDDYSINSWINNIFAN